MGHDLMLSILVFRFLQRSSAVLLALVFAAALNLVPGAQAQDQAFTPSQEDALRQLIRSYLLENPEVLVEALESYREQQERLAERRKQDAVAANRSALEKDPATPVLGNPDGDVVVVEFFDYRCPYCKRGKDTLFEVVEADGNVRLVMKEFPILGPDSLHAARVALAAGKQDKYREMHVALMEAQGELDEAGVAAIAESIGLDAERLKRDMLSEEIEKALRENYELADALDIGGTPAFVIGDTLVPGAIDPDSLRALIAKARSG